MPLPPTTNAASFGWEDAHVSGRRPIWRPWLLDISLPGARAVATAGACVALSSVRAGMALIVELKAITRTARVSLTWYGVDALAPIDSGRRGALHKALPSLHRAGTAASPPSSRGAARRRWGPPAARCSNTSRRRNQDSLVIHRSHALRVEVRLRGRKRRRR